MAVISPRYLIFTGGHHTSGLTVAAALKSPRLNIIWFGHRHSMWADTADSAEYQEVISRGIKFYDLKAGKFYRTYHPLKLLRLPWGFIQAFFLVGWLRLRYRRQLIGVVSFGGYLAVPVALAAWLWKLPIITHEQTLVSGWANRFIGHLSQVIALTWPESIKYYPASKCRVVGLPLRTEIKALRPPLSPAPAACLYFTGGKQGSHLINKVVFTLLSELLPHYFIYHQTGSGSQHRDDQESTHLHASLPPELKSRYFPFTYLTAPRVADIYRQNPIVISRSGAHTVYELAYLGLRAVLIPIPWSSHDEQILQAQLLVNRRQAIILPQNQLKPQNLITAINQAVNLNPKPADIADNGLENMVQLIKQQFGIQ